MQTSSPTISDEPQEIMDGMSFIDALKIILLGKKVHKIEWDDREFYLQINEGRLRLHKPDGKWYDFITSETDMLGEDYIQIF